MKRDNSPDNRTPLRSSQRRTTLRALRAAGLVLAIVWAGAAFAGDLEDTCRNLYRTLSSSPHKSLKKSAESFTQDGKRYNGCVIRLSGNINELTGTQHPDDLFGRLPYCPDGKLPAGTPRDILNEEGWCGDKMADGPDGTSYVAINKSVFCVVEGRWDGGDDSDPTYVPSSKYDVVVKCAKR